MKTAFKITNKSLWLLLPYFIFMPFSLYQNFFLVKIFKQWFHFIKPIIISYNSSCSRVSVASTNWQMDGVTNSNTYSHLFGSFTDVSEFSVPHLIFTCNKQQNETCYNSLVFPAAEHCIQEFVTEWKIHVTVNTHYRQFMARKT